MRKRLLNFNIVAILSISLNIASINFNIYFTTFFFNEKRCLESTQDTALCELSFRGEIGKETKLPHKVSMIAHFRRRVQQPPWYYKYFRVKYIIINNFLT